jgi:large subunit ribosomal protein L18
MNLYRRKLRNRYKLNSVNYQNLVRLSVFISNKQIYIQAIHNQHTIAAISTLSKSFYNQNLKTRNNRESAKWAGKKISEKLKILNIDQVIFDRGGKKYHKNGRLDSVASSAREAGLII